MLCAVFTNELMLAIEVIRYNKAYCRLSEFNTMMKIFGVTEKMYNEVMKGEE